MQDCCKLRYTPDRRTQEGSKVSVSRLEPETQRVCVRAELFTGAGVTFDEALVVMLLQQAAVVGQLLVFVRLRQEIGPG